MFKRFMCFLFKGVFSEATGAKLMQTASVEWQGVDEGGLSHARGAGDG